MNTPIGTASLYKIDGDKLVKHTTIFCAAMIVFTGAADFFFYYLELLPGRIIRRSFNIGIEESLGTWVSTNLTLFVGIVAAALWKWSENLNRLSVRFGWAIVSLFFIFVSFDDAAKFHERAGTNLRVKYESLSGNELETWFPSWGWQLFVLPMFAIAGLYILWFLWTAVAPRLRVWVLVGFGLFALAVSTDFVEGMELLSTWEAEHLLRLFEEVIEMFGALAFLYVFLQTLNERVGLHLSLKE